MNIAERLMQGSRNIDQMRKDIDQVVGIILGMINVKDHCCESKEREFSFKSSFRKGYWYISLTLGEVIVIYKPDAGSPTSTTVFSSIKLKFEKTGVQTKDVQAVYEALPIFVEGMVKKFPKHTWKIEPLLKAGKMKL